MAEQMQELGFSLTDYIEVLKRRWLGALGIALLLIAASVWLAWSLPATYESNGTVLVEREEIPEGLVNRTVTGYAQERIEDIKQRALTRERLVEMAKQHDLYSELLDKEDVTTAVSKMRQALAIELLDVEQNPGNRRGQSKVVIAFTVAFQTDDAEVAQAVVTEVMDIFLEENQALRIEQSGEVVSFFERTSTELEGEIDEIERKISVYKQSRAFALPDQVLSSRRKLSDLEQDLISLADRERAVINQRNELDVQLENMDPYYSGGGSSRVISPGAQLVQARVELAAARERYSDIHPEIGRLELLITGLEKEVGQSGRGNQNQSASSPTNPEYLRAESKLKSLGVDLLALVSQRKQLRSEISDLEASILQAPEVERELRAMSIELETSRRQYKELRDKEMDARLAADVEIDQKGGGFRILESASLPSVPVSPDRAGFVALGFLVAVFVALLWMFLAEMLDRSVRGQRGLLRATGLVPIAIVPNMSTS